MIYRLYFRRLLLVPFLLLLFSFNLYANCADTSLVIGEFKIKKIIDGDTFRFEGLDKSTRFLCLDTEETYKGDDAQQKSNEIARDWTELYKNEKKKHNKPVKMDTYFGYDTWQWTKEFFKDVDIVRLEKDDNLRTIDIFNRYLVYVIAIKNGKEYNYNLECVRAGKSPYFNKYGNSKRFHQLFVDAQQYAKDNKLGIWGPDCLCYPDYPERLKWWNFRADQLDNFDKKYANVPEYFHLGNDGEFERMKGYVGKEVTVFCGISEVLTQRNPYILRIPISKDENFEVIIFKDNAGILNEVDIDEKKEYYTYIKGKLEIYKGRYQIILKNKNQIWAE